MIAWCEAMIKANARKTVVLKTLAKIYAKDNQCDKALESHRNSLH